MDYIDNESDLDTSPSVAMVLVNLCLMTGFTASIALMTLYMILGT